MYIYVHYYVFIYYHYYKPLGPPYVYLCQVLYHRHSILTIQCSHVLQSIQLRKGYLPIKDKYGSVYHSTSNFVMDEWILPLESWESYRNDQVGQGVQCEVG